jgi:hypothetical protein
MGRAAQPDRPTSADRGRVEDPAIGLHIIQFECRRRVARLADKKSSAIKICNRWKYRLELDLALHGPGRIARQHVDGAGLQCSKTIFRIEWNVANPARTIEHRRRQRAAELDMETGPFPSGQ